MGVLLKNETLQFALTLAEAAEAEITKSRRFRFIEGPVQYALLAKGSIDVAMDAVMHPWDIAALAPCIEEAGGVVSDLEGHREGLCTKNTSWALIERPYSCAPQAVGAVYDRPGFFVQSLPRVVHFEILVR
ncbi:MAG: hypothetical protein DMG15_10090 [Acidobacteria bacterium]|nr:MAG: hypothetical protein DMG15_10090 [Acidobacteriota bacterium]